ncbi:MAG TPA: hypothetical protein VL424_05425 [Pararobbsia sp.]|jgi:hypothetical protein|nr:hypothetical protein [Pararobbsia sp.]
MKKRSAASEPDAADGRQALGRVLGPQARKPRPVSGLHGAAVKRERRTVRTMRQGHDRAPPGFSGVMSRVCEMVWPVWPDTASSEHGADLAGADDLTVGSGVCGTAVSRHSVLQRTPVAPVDQRRAACTPI